MAKIKNIVMPIAVTLLLVIVLELAARIILSRIYNRKFDKTLIEENVYGTSSGLRADAQGTVWGKDFHTDASRSRKNDKSKNTGHKLLVIGDSVTEGVGIDDSSTFANIINNSIDSADVQNLSLIGWSNNDYRNVIDKVIDSSYTKVYLFYCLNDIYGQTKSSELPAIGNKGFISTINSFLQDYYGTYKLIKLLIYQNSNRYFTYDEAFYKDEAMVKKTVDDLAHIRAICKEKGVDFRVFILPYRSQLQNESPATPQLTLAYHLGMSGIKFHDLIPDLKNAGKASDLYLFADEIHLSAEGHKAVAQAVMTIK